MVSFQNPSSSFPGFRDVQNKAIVANGAVIVISELVQKLPKSYLKCCNVLFEISNT